VPVSVSAVLVAGVMTSLWFEARRQTERAEQAQRKLVMEIERGQMATLLAMKARGSAKASESKALAREKDTQRALAQLRQSQQTERQALTTAEQQRLRAEQEAVVARQQQGRAEQQTRIVRRQARIAQLREQVEKVGNLLSTPDAFFGMLLSIDVWDQSRSFSSLHTTSAYALMHALQRSREASWLTISKETRDVQISGDGSRIVGVFQGGIGIWNGKSGALIRILGKGSGVSDVGISGDGSRIVGIFQGGIGIWNGRSGALIRTLDAGWVIDLEISGDGRRIVGGLKGGIVRIWDIESGALVRTLQGAEEVARVGISADGSRIVEGLASQPLFRIWDVKSGALIRKYSHKHFQKGLSALAISGDGDTIVFALQGITRPSLLDVESGVVNQLPLLQLATPSLPLDTVAISNDGRRIVTSSLEGPVQIWDVYKLGRANDNYAREIGSMSIGRDHTSSVAISGDGNRIVAIPLSGPGRIWDMKSEAVIQALQGSVDAEVKAISSDGSRAVGTLDDGKVGIWDVMSGALIRSLEAGGRVNEVAISGDGRRIAVAVDSKPVRIVDATSGAVIRILPRTMVAISSNGRHAVGTLGDQKVEIWDLMSGALLRTLEVGRGVTDALISGDGSRIVGLFDRGFGIGIWNAKSGALIRSLEAERSVHQVAISGDGRLIAVNVDSKSVQTLDGRSGAVLQALQGSEGLMGVAISNDGNWIVGSIRDGIGTTSIGSLQMWDAKSGRPITPQIKIDGMEHLAINGDGSRIVSISGNKVYQLMGSPEGWLYLACRRIWYHPQLRQPEKFMSDHEKIAVARRARGVCERVVGHGLKQQ
jgi:WD40 repeat protein